jgi:sigma-70-like protein
MPRSERIHREPDGDGYGGGDGMVIPGLELPDLADLTEPAVLETELQEIAPGARRPTAAERAAQIEVDRRIVARLASEGFAGPNTDKLLLATFDHAMAVMKFLVDTGRIFDACARLRRTVRRQHGDDQWTVDDREHLVGSSVDAGVFHVFREYGLRRGRWSPSGGASLATYGVNACVLCFPPVYQKWWRARVLERSFGDLAADVPPRLQADLRQPDPAKVVSDRDEAERYLRQMPQPLRTAVWMRAVEGASQAEAAEFVGMTERSLESRLGRARASLGLSGRDGPPKAGHKPEPELEAQEGDRDR